MAGLNVTIGADSGPAQKELNHFQRATKKIAQDIAKGFKERIGHKLLDGFTGAARAIPGILSDAVNSASDLREEINKSQAVFGKSSQALIDWSKGTAEALGISRVAALEATGTMGNMLLAFGVGAQEASVMSKELVTLAADMASFNNASVEDTIFAIGAAMRGETEPIRKYGVSLNDARLKEEALALGLYSGKGALDANAKAMAAYNAILNQTRIQQGDSAKTANELAGSKRRLLAQFEDLKTQIGSSLLPAFSDLVAGLRKVDFESLGNQISSVIKMLIDLAPTIAKVGTALAAIKLVTFFTTMTTGLIRTTSLWAAQTIAINANTKAKAKNAAVGGGAMAAGGILGSMPKLAAIAATAYGGFKAGEIFGKDIADVLVPDDKPGILSGPTHAAPKAGGYGLATKGEMEQGEEAVKIQEKINEKYSIDSQILEARIAGNEKLVKYLERGLEIQKIQNEYAQDGVKLEHEKAVAILEQREAAEKKEKEQKKEKAQKSITQEYKDTLAMLNARISGNKELIEQEKIKQEIQEEQKRSAVDGIMLDKDKAREIVMARRAAEKAEKDREDKKTAAKDAQKQELADLKEKEGETEKAFGSAIGRSSIRAVSSMQAIGGGGGVSGELNLQKTQTDLLRQLVTLQSSVAQKTEDLKKGPVNQ